MILSITGCDDQTSIAVRAVNKAALFLWGCVFSIGFNGDFHLRTRFEPYLVAVFVRQSILNAYLPIEVFRPSHGNLRFLRFIWKWRFDDFFYRCWQE